MAYPRLNYPGANSPTATYFVGGSCNIREDYRTNPILMGSALSTHDYTGYTSQNNSTIVEIVTEINPAKRYAGYVFTDENGEQTVGFGGTNALTYRYHNKIWHGVIVESDSYGQVSYLPPPTYNFAYRDTFAGTFATNIPIFEDMATAESYKNAVNDAAALQILQTALNFDNSIELVGTPFEFMCQYTTGTWDAYGVTPPSYVSVIGYRGYVIDGEIKLIKIDGVSDSPSGKALLYTIDGASTAQITNLEKTEDGINWTTCDALPEFFYRTHINELGTFIYAISVEDSTNDNEEWSISDENETGDEDDGEDWGDVYVKSFFSQQYICGTGAIGEISDALYDVSPGGLWEDIKQGLDMMGDNPMQAVQSLMYYPMDLTDVFTDTVSTSDIWFGGYKFTMTSNTANRIAYPEGHFYCGGVIIKRQFNDWRDAYIVRLFVDLPYCGRYELDPVKYYGKFVKVIYYIDTHTGGCCACLVTDGGTSGKNGKCQDRFNGQIGCQVPITLTDFSAYANAQINTLLGGGGQAMTQGGEGINSAVGAAATSGAMGVIGAGAGVAVSGAVQGAKTVYGLQLNNINKFNQTRGGSSSMLNQHLNQMPKFIFEYPELDIPNDFYQTHGYPSNYSGYVGSFSGYLEADQVKLNMPGATDEEKDRATTLLLTGIYL